MATQRQATAAPEALLAQWVSAMAEAGVERDPAWGEGQALLARYGEPHRRYHTVEHLSEVLAALDLLAAPAPPPLAARGALWFHDAVYEPTARTGWSEEASAALAVERLGALGVGAALVAEVKRLISLTAAHAVGGGDDVGALVVDADLAVLGAPPERYRRYVADVRAEYAHVDDAGWSAGRSAVLTGFLERTVLFRTEGGRHRLDGPARRNLGGELAALRRAQPQA